MNINATMLGQAIMFVLFVWFCMKFIWPPIMGAIEKRQKDISQGWASLQSAKKELESTKATILTLKKKAKLEASTIIQEANKQKLALLQEARQKAIVEKEKIIAQGMEMLEVERIRVRDELTKQLATLVVTGAEKIVGRSIDAAANKDITDKLIAEL